MTPARALACLLGVAALAHGEPVADLVQQGDALEQKGRPSDALAAYLRANELQPGDSRTLRRISKQYLQQMTDARTGREELGAQALDYARRAVQSGPADAEAHLSLAIVYGKVAFLKSPKERIEYSNLIQSEARRAVELDPANDLGWHVLGRWNYEIAGLSVPMKFFARTFYGKLPDGSYGKALECFEKAVALNPARLANQAELGRTLAALGRKDEARATLEKALGMPAREKDDDETKTRARAALEALD